MGDYIRKKKLGEGGFGEVWLARHVALDVLHAVKFIHPGSVSSPTEFYREPRLLKALEHRNIVEVYDAGFDGPELYIAMEYLKAGSLDDVCSRGPVKLKRIKPIFCDALKGLQWVHDKGYLHRDIKPANILIDKMGAGKLADFGLALPIREAILAAPAGTLTYLAPEVLITGEMTRLTDIYAMGVSLYEAVNGSAYLPGITDTTILYNDVVAGNFPDRHYYKIYVPKSLRLVINKAMNLDSVRRFQSADDFRQALERTKMRCSWTEKTIGGRPAWVTHNDSRVLTVRLLGSSPWEVDVRQRKSDAALERRVGRLCGVFPSEALARRRVAEITQGLVSGKDLGVL
jgi:eukaryotic-like serine/threonine-protein kinase